MCIYGGIGWGSRQSRTEPSAGRGQAIAVKRSGARFGAGSSGRCLEVRRWWIGDDRIAALHMVRGNTLHCATRADSWPSKSNPHHRDHDSATMRIMQTLEKRAWESVRARIVTATSAMLLLSITSTTRAQDRVVVVVGANIPVTRGWESRPLIEPHLIAHPRVPGHLLGTMMVTTAAPDGTVEQPCATVLSVDGGLAWQQTTIDLVECGDPWLSMTPDGQAVLTVLGRTSSMADSSPHLLAFSSLDGGRTWNASPQDLGSGHDHMTGISDSSGNTFILSAQGMRDSTGSVRFPIYVARRTSATGAFDVLQRFVPSNLNQNTQGLAVLSDGTLVASFVDFQRPRPPGGSPRDGLLERPRTWALSLAPATTAFGVPQLISESCASGSYLAADLTAGPYRDRLYHLCNDPSASRIEVGHSSDRGERWSNPQPLEVNAGKAKSRIQPQVTVNKNGVIGVSWLDGRDDPAGRCYALYFTASLNGGNTFLPPTRVSTKPSCPDPKRNGASFDRWPQGGDYHGLAATSEGIFHAFWPDASSGIFQTMAARLEVRPQSK